MYGEGRVRLAAVAICGLLLSLSILCSQIGAWIVIRQKDLLTRLTPHPSLTACTFLVIRLNIHAYVVSQFVFYARTNLPHDLLYTHTQTRTTYHAKMFTDSIDWLSFSKSLASHSFVSERNRREALIHGHTQFHHQPNMEHCRSVMTL